MEIISKKLTEDYSSEAPNYKGFRYTIEENTLTEDITPSFFNSNFLACIDIGHRGDPTLSSSLDSVVLEGNRIIQATVSEYYVPGSTADVSGHLYWIQIPREHHQRTFEVEFLTETTSSPFVPEP